MRHIINLFIALYITACGTQETKESRIASASPTPIADEYNTTAEGRDGKDGKDGKDGVDGKDGQDGRDSLTTNEWYDAVSGKHWFMGDEGPQSMALLYCTGAYKVPSVEELQAACYRGLFKAYAAQLGVAPLTAAWASINLDYVNTSTCLASTQANGTPSTIVCVEK